MKKICKPTSFAAGLTCLALLVGALVSCGPRVVGDLLETAANETTAIETTAPDESSSEETVVDDVTTSDSTETTSVLPDDTIPVETASGETTAVETLVETDPAPEALITPEEFDRINIAWSKKYGIGVQFLKSIDDIRTVDADSSAWAYLYGKFDDCLVLFSFDALYKSGEMSLAGHTFVFPVDYTLWVCKGTTYYTLEDAFKKGALTHEQIGAIAEIHRQNMIDIEAPGGK